MAKIRALQVGQVDLSAPTKSNVRLLVKVRLEQVYYLSKTTPPPWRALAEKKILSPRRKLMSRHARERCYVDVIILITLKKNLIK